MHLNISADKSQQVSVMYVKNLKKYIHSIVKNLYLQKKNCSMIISMAISGFCSLATKGQCTWNFILRWSVIRILVLSTLFMFLLCLKVLILLKIWTKFYESFHGILRNCRVRGFVAIRLCGYKIKVFKGIFQHVTTNFYMTVQVTKGHQQLTQVLKT